LEWKKKMVTEVRDSVEAYSNIYIFRVIGMRGPGLRELRKAWRDSRIFLGKNKVMALALGKSSESEISTNAHKIAERLKVHLLYYLSIYCVTNW
jgi:mRNA turnover protein 4